MKMRSLTRRLIGGVLVAELFCVTVFALVSLTHEMHGRRRAFDVMLRGRADSLLGAVYEVNDLSGNLSLNSKELSAPAEDIYVASTAGGIVGRSPEVPLDVLAAIRTFNSSGYFNFKWKGIEYRAFYVQAQRTLDEGILGGQALPIALLYASPTFHLEHEVTEAARFYAGASAFLLIVTGMALVGFLHWWLLPLRDLAASARHVSTTSWDFMPPEAALRSRELAPMANSIKKLLHGLHRAFERQRQFTGDAAHELKTSIALLRSSLQLMTMRKRSVEEYEKGAENLLIDIQRIQELIEQMLLLARIEEAPPAPVQKIDLSTVVKTVAQRLQPIAEARKITVDVHVDAASHVVMDSSDASVLASNLILNALQHSPMQGAVTVSVLLGDKGTELRVADKGEGIPEEALPHVFERFYRADVSRSRHNGGAGLGLAICKAIVDRANGIIMIQSKLGQGTEVIVKLPAKK
jgi:signal transduction histidine kinase